MKKFLPIAMAAVMSISTIAVSAVSVGAVENISTPVQYAQVAKASLATPKISKAESVYGGVKLTWGKVNGAAKYRVYYKGSNGWTRMIDTTSTSYIDKDVLSGKSYTYTVRCLSADGKSFTSGYDSKGVSVYTDDSVCPEILGVSTASNGIELYWDDVCDGDSKYRIYVKENGSWKKIAETYDNYYLHKGVKAGKSYTYTVRGVSFDGKRFTTLYNPSGVTFKYKTTDKTRDAYINYMLKHQDEWMPEKIAGYYAQAGVEFVDLDFDGVPELIAQEAGDDGQNFDAQVYTFKNGKLQLVENDEVYIQNSLAFLYNKSSKKYEIHGMGMINAVYDAGLTYMTNYLLDYNGTKVAMKPYSSKLIQLPDFDECDDLMYVYFNGSNDVITRLKYNEINMSKIGNCVDAHMHSQFVCTYSYDDDDIWGDMSNSERKQALVDAYSAFSYDKY